MKINAIFNMITNGEQEIKKERTVTLGELTPEWWI